MKPINFIKYLSTFFFRTPNTSYNNNMTFSKRETESRSKKRIKLYTTSGSTSSSSSKLCNTCTTLKSAPSSHCRRRRFLFDRHRKNNTIQSAFQPNMTKRIRDLVNKKSKNKVKTIQDIQDSLLKKYPHHHKQITKEAIKSCIQSQYPKLSLTTSSTGESSEQQQEKKEEEKKEKLQIENKYSIFIDEAMITLNIKKDEEEEGETTDSGPSSSSSSEEEGDDEQDVVDRAMIFLKTEKRLFQKQAKATTTDKLKVHLMLAISSRGLEKLEISLESRHCHVEFLRSLFNTLPPDVPYQIVMKSDVQDINQVQQDLFSNRFALHTLYAYPYHTLSPVKKYIAKLANECLPKEPIIKNEQDLALLFKEATEQITKKVCQKWIQNYLRN